MAIAEGTAYILGARPWGESGVVAVLFCPARGLLRGLVRRADTAMLQPFNSVNYRHTRRLENQLGSLQLELTKSRASLWLGHSQRALGVAAAADILAAILPEEHPYPVVAQVLAPLMQSDWGWRAYAGFERVLLEHVGYGLHLHNPIECTEGSALAYVSPNTWRAVPQSVARGWEDRLFVLPTCWGGLAMDEAQECAAALRLTGALLTRALHGPFAPEKLASRARLIDFYTERLAVPLAVAA
jgi:DNA repair protein RecO (recombination protein O)